MKPSNNKKAIKLSFQTEEEEENEDGGNFNIKFSKNKMKQANVKIPVAEATKPLVATAQYDVNSLKALKEQQKFASDAPPSVPEVIDGLEEKMDVEETILNGEEAELLEKQAENPDQITEEEKNMLKKLEEKSKKNKNRIYTDYHSEDTRKNIDMNQDIDMEWEREMMKRGSIHTNPDKLPELIPNSSNSGLLDSDIMDIINTVQDVYGKIQSLVEDDEREIEKLTVELKLLEKEREELLKEQEIEENKMKEAEEKRKAELAAKSVPPAPTESESSEMIVNS
jgi:hypothetical protein